MISTSGRRVVHATLVSWSWPGWEGVGGGWSLFLHWLSGNASVGYPHVSVGHPHPLLPSLIPSMRKWESEEKNILAWMHARLGRKATLLLSLREEWRWVIFSSILTRLSQPSMWRFGHGGHGASSAVISCYIYIGLWPSGGDKLIFTYMIQ